MQISGIPTWLAPVTTGHPLGLPEANRQAQEAPRVKPIQKRGDPDAALAEGRPPAQFWRGTRGEPDPADHVAPPSIMQIRISRMLDEQASQNLQAAAPGQEVPQQAQSETDATEPRPEPEQAQPWSQTRAEARAETRQATRGSGGGGGQSDASDARSAVFNTLP